MARKKTNMTKKEENKQVYTVFEKNIQNTPQTKSSGKWVKFGKRDDFPYTLLDLYNNSPSLNACVTFCTSALIGNGIILDGVQSTPCYKYGWNEFIRRLSTDFFYSGSFAFQVIKNRDQKTYSFYHQPIETVRCSERDADGVINSWWLSNDWSSPNKPGNEPVEIPSFIMRPDGEYNIKSGQPYLYVYESYTPQASYYWLPIWQSAMKSVQAECEYMNFDYSNSVNAFLPSGCLSLPPAADSEERDALVEEIKNTFIGSSNSARLLISFRNDSDDQPIKFEKFNSDSQEFDLFSSANERAISRILASFNIPSRLLIGYPEQNAGFSSEGQLLQTAFNVYNELAGKHYRNVILGTVNELFRLNGIDIELTVEDLKFDNSDSSTAVSESNDDTRDETANVDISDENIEEQEQ